MINWISSAEADMAASRLTLIHSSLLMISRRPRCLTCSKPGSRRRRLAPPPWTLFHPVNANTIPSIRWSLPPFSKSKVQRDCNNPFFFFLIKRAFSPDLTAFQWLSSFNKPKNLHTQSRGGCILYIHFNICLFCSVVSVLEFQCTPQSVICWLEVNFLMQPLSQQTVLQYVSTLR